MHADAVAVFLALDADMKTLAEGAQVLGEPASAGKRKIQRLQIGPHRVYAVIMGSGCVETAVSAEALLGRFRCDIALSAGPAGGLTEAAPRGSWFRVDRCVVQGKSSGPGSRDDALVMEKISENWPLDGLLGSAAPAVLSSGEVFVNRASQRTQMSASTGAILVDMNTHGLSAACANHQVPLHVWRVVSDLADEAASQTFRDFVKQYDGAGGKALAALIRELPANPNAAGSYPGIQNLLKQPEQPEQKEQKEK